MRPQYEIRLYSTADGKIPFAEWLQSLKDYRGAAIIVRRLDRLILGHFGDHRHIGGALWELKIAFGPGYRIYFAKENNRIIVLFCGGDKGSQERDIEKAKKYWTDYWRQLNEK